LHVLNNCNHRLHHYRRRHDAILHRIGSELSHLGLQFTLDQSLDSTCTSIRSSLRPDIIIYSNSDRKLSSVEMSDLKISFLSSRSMAQADQRNIEKYSPFVVRMQRKGLSSSISTLLVSSTGVIPDHSVTLLRNS
jgi:hypothetical protein